MTLRRGDRRTGAARACAFAPGRRASSTARSASGTLDLPLACQRAQALATRPFKFTVTGPHMLAKTLLDRHYADPPELAHAHRRRARRAGAPPRRRRGPARRGQPARPSRGMGMGRRRRSTACSTRCPTTPAVHLCFGNYGGQSVQKGTWEQLMRYLNALHADHVVLECAHRPPEELAVFKDAQAGDRLRPRRDRHQGDRGRVGRRGRARDRARREAARRRPRQATSIPTAASGC